MENKLAETFQDGANPASNHDDEIRRFRKLGDACVIESEYEGGLNLYREALKLPQSNGSRANLFTNCGLALLARAREGLSPDKNQDLNDAVDYLQCALDCGQQPSNIYYSLMSTYKELGDHHMVCHYAQKILTLLNADHNIAIFAKIELEQTKNNLIYSPQPDTSLLN